MRVLGLTGSIGMGKSTAAADFRRLGIAVHDADAVVHGLLGPGGEALTAIDSLFPGVVGTAGVDRQALGARVFHDPTGLKKLEAILHPLVRRAEQGFLRRQMARQAPFVVLDIPLLFETHGESRCDAVAVVTAPPFVQSRRVLARSGMTREKFHAILARQVPDGEKRHRADFVIQTGLGRRFSLLAIKRIVAGMKSGYTRRRKRSSHA
ncbi:dephospho-CoA kinase [Magnetospira sp. QH-2]|uniref:dephospho-CoA kinase n=1 Tax=Magnetospira sp. (strain QH-2) TaxID=1288970 RepID=UPI0003E816E7|nr:dephospho-CoA kinase [Magnetospira sp. QH-2]CCQ75625.1 Dephospho-CoA kinase [Magnetospira sp. QH-2]